MTDKQVFWGGITKEANLILAAVVNYRLQLPLNVLFCTGNMSLWLVSSSQLPLKEVQLR